MKSGHIGDSSPANLMLRPFREFARLQASGGILLVAASIVALVWSNSGWSESYEQLWHGTTLSVAFGDHALTLSLVGWINDLLMAGFFFLVGLEIKREVLVGQLSSLRAAALPICGAIGGMVVPGAAYVLLNLGGATRGWGVPVATDIAFALGFLALASKAPIGLKVFLASLAIADDIGALAVIALFYTDHIHTQWLVYAAIFLAGLILANKLGFVSPLVYIGLGLPIWFAIHESGVHATIAGVIVAMTIPARASVKADDFLTEAQRALKEFDDAAPDGNHILTNARMLGAVHAIDTACDRVETPLQRLEHSLHPWISFLVIPIFAIANAGVPITVTTEAMLNPITVGVVVGLALGKPVGILITCWAAVKFGFARLPDGVSWWQLAGAACLAGIGFTMSLFIANLAFKSADQLVSAKLGIIVASTIAAIAGFIILVRSNGNASD
jgi:NhaA family Na+:H+ antiporter